MQDIDEVGDNRHDTFFEMMGNWSLGDYFKEEAIAWSWEFLTSPQWLGLDPKKLAISVFSGDADAPFDEEASNTWIKMGVPEHKIAKLSKKSNWWGPAGQTGPCGPDTEMFYWKGETEFPPVESNPGNDEDHWLEIWNDVFMQYFKKKEGSFEQLKQQNVDTGMGLERTLVTLNDFMDVFQIDTFWPLIQKIEEVSGHSYIEGGEIRRAMRIVADHLRTATMIMGDDRGIAPSNVDQGYVVRRLIRRAIRYARVLGITENFCVSLSLSTIEIFKDVYAEVQRNKEFVLLEMGKEEKKFRNTLEKGMKILESRMMDNETKKITGSEAFDLYQSYGFPIEITEELAKEKGLEVDIEGFIVEMKKHQELSRAGAEQKFKGGLADTSEISTKYHTATHLLHAALREVLGIHVEQRGSNITAERLRFDFSHSVKMTEEEKKKVEDLVNAAIIKDYKISFAEMTVPEAKAGGAVGLFEEKYGNKVKVYTIGEPSLHPHADPNSPTFSKEICGGPHVECTSILGKNEKEECFEPLAEHTGLLGHFKIIKEEAVSSGIRRIKAVLQ